MSEDDGVDQSDMSHGNPGVYALLGTPQVLQRALDNLPAVVAPYLNLVLQEIDLKKLPPCLKKLPPSRHFSPEIERGWPGRLVSLAPRGIAAGPLSAASIAYCNEKGGK